MEKVSNEVKMKNEPICNRSQISCEKLRVKSRLSNKKSISDSKRTRQSIKVKEEPIDNDMETS